MSDQIESGLAVTKITDVHAEERRITALLKGVKTVVHNDTGFDLEDIVEIEVKLKCTMMKTLNRLGADSVENMKVLILRDRDTTLLGFGEQLVEP